MLDQYHRNIHYLRISVTDSCNLRCRYCMPLLDNHQQKEEILTDEEILRIVKLASSLQIDTIRITGGEPLVRKDVCQLIKKIKQIKGIKKVSITTNGILLAKYLDDLIEAGIDSINISLDTLDAQKFKLITGFDGLDQVLEGIKMALNKPVKVKINCVPQKGINDQEFAQFARLTKDNNLSIRFIEMMPIGMGSKFSEIDNSLIKNQILATWPKLEKLTTKLGDGPASYYQIPGYKGSIGFIGAVHEKFCDNCNRIRLTANGFVKSCLGSKQGIDLKVGLRDGSNDELLIEQIKEVIYHKPLQHHFDEVNEDSENKEMYKIGG